MNLGLFDSERNCLAYTDDNSSPYQVSCCGLASKCINGLEKGKYYVCDCSYAEPEQFWEAPFFSIDSYQSANRAECSDNVCCYRVHTNADNTITVETTQKSRAAYLERVDE